MKITRDTQKIILKEIIQKRKKQKFTCYLFFTCLHFLQIITIFCFVTLPALEPKVDFLLTQLPIAIVHSVLFLALLISGVTLSLTDPSHPNNSHLIKHQKER
jgi:hypothetical protein